MPAFILMVLKDENCWSLMYEKVQVNVRVRMGLAKSVFNQKGVWR